MCMLSQQSFSNWATYGYLFEYICVLFRESSRFLLVENWPRRSLRARSLVVDVPDLGRRESSKSLSWAIHCFRSAYESKPGTLVNIQKAFEKETVVVVMTIWQWARVCWGSGIIPLAFPILCAAGEGGLKGVFWSKQNRQQPPERSFKVRPRQASKSRRNAAIVWAISGAPSSMPLPSSSLPSFIQIWQSCCPSLGLVEVVANSIFWKNSYLNNVKSAIHDRSSVAKQHIQSFWSVRPSDADHQSSCPTSGA